MQSVSEGIKIENFSSMAHIEAVNDSTPGSEKDTTLINKKYSQPDDTLLFNVAMLKDRCLGYVIVRKDLKKSDTAFLPFVTVLKDFQGKGLEITLMEKACQKTQELGLPLLSLHCSSEKINFYTQFAIRAGYAHTQERVGAYRNGDPKFLITYSLKNAANREGYLKADNFLQQIKASPLYADQDYEGKRLRAEVEKLEEMLKSAEAPELTEIILVNCIKHHIVNIVAKAKTGQEEGLLLTSRVVTLAGCRFVENNPEKFWIWLVYQDSATREVLFNEFPAILEALNRILEPYGCPALTVPVTDLSIVTALFKANALPEWIKLNILFNPDDHWHFKLEAVDDRGETLLYQVLKKRKQMKISLNEIKYYFKKRPSESFNIKDDPALKLIHYILSEPNSEYTARLLNTLLDKFPSEQLRRLQLELSEGALRRLVHHFTQEGKGLAIYLKEQLEKKPYGRECLISDLANPYIECRDILLLIERFDITDEKERAKLLLGHIPYNFNIVKKIDSLGITDQDLLYELAKKSACAFDGFYMWVQKYGIQDEERRFKLAQIRSPKKHIKNCEIRDPEKLFKLAETWACSQNPEGIWEYFAEYKIETEEQRVHIARICAANVNDLEIVSHFDKFGINNPQVRMEIIWLLVGKIEDIVLDANKFEIGNALANNISAFEIPSEEERFKLAQAVLPFTDNPFVLLKNFELSREDYLTELAITLSEKHGSNLCKHFNALGSLQEENRYRIAQYLALHWGKFSEQIDHFNLEESNRYYVACFAAKNGTNLPENIEKYRLTDPVKRFEIAEIAAANCTGKFSLHIAKFHIDDPILLNQLARTAIQHDRLSLEHIQNYNIVEEADRFLLAKLAAQTPARNISRNIDNFKLRNPKYLIEIAQIAAAKQGVFSSNIERFKIEDEEQRIALAYIALKHFPNELFKSIEFYAISDEEVRFQLALGLAKCLSTFSGTEKFLLEEEHRYKVAEKSVSCHPQYFSVSIQKYSLNDLQQLLKIARIAAKTDPFFCSNFKNYGISEEPDRLELAHLAIENNSGFYSEHFGKFDISSETDRIAIARIAAKKDWRFCRNFKNYAVSKESDRIELALLAAENKESNFSEHFADFNISSGTYPIACKEALFNPNFSKFLANYKIASIEDRTILASIQAHHHPKSYLQHYENYALDVPSGEKVALEAMCCLENISCIHATNLPLISRVVAEVLMTFPGNGDLNSGLVDRVIMNIRSAYSEMDLQILPKQPKTMNTKEYYSFLMRFIGKCIVHEVPIQNVTWLFKSGLIDQILEIRQEDLRIQMSYRAVEIASVNSTLEGLKEALPTFPEHAHLPLLLVKSLAQLDIRPPNGDKIICSRIFKTPQKRLYLLQVLNKLHYPLGLDVSDTNYLLDLIFNLKGSELLQNLAVLHTIFEVRAFSELSQAAIKAKNNQIDKILEELFCQSIPLKAIEGFKEKMGNTFLSWRDSTAIFRYALKVAQGDFATKTCLAGYIESVLEGRYLEERYKISEDRSHMHALFAARPKLLELWRQNVCQDLEIKETNEDPRTDFKTFFTDKIIRDGHMTKEQLPWLAQVLSIKEVDLRLFYKECKEAEKGTEATKLLLIQKKAIQLCSPKMDARQQISELETFLDLLEGLSEPPADFLEDVKQAKEGLLQKLAKSSSLNYTGWTVQLTDDSEDCLLIGTEVGDSCQGVDRGIGTNRCLLGYVVDGKNKCLVIKDSEGTIRARRILRLLIRKEDQQPALFFERLYPSVVRPELSQALLSFAKDQARRLDLPLYSKSDTGIPYPGELSSLGSPAPWEYFDSGNGAVKGSEKHTITDLTSL